MVNHEKGVLVLVLNIIILGMEIELQSIDLRLGVLNKHSSVKYSWIHTYIHSQLWIVIDGIGRWWKQHCLRMWKISLVVISIFFLFLFINFHLLLLWLVILLLSCHFLLSLTGSPYLSCHFHGLFCLFCCQHNGCLLHMRVWCFLLFWGFNEMLVLWRGLQPFVLVGMLSFILEILFYYLFCSPIIPVPLQERVVLKCLYASSSGIGGRSIAFSVSLTTLYIFTFASAGISAHDNSQFKWPPRARSHR